MKHLVRISMALVALAAAALSYQSLAQLGTLCGYGVLAWLYPVTVDLGAAASCAAWLHTRGRQPLAMTWALLVISVLLNGTTHFLSSTGTTPHWLLVVAVAAVPPMVLGLTVHLAVGLGQPTPAALVLTREDKPVAEPVAEPVRPEPLHSVPDLVAEEPPALTGLLRGDLLERARRIVTESEQTVGRNRLAKALDVTPHQARQLLAELA